MSNTLVRLVDVLSPEQANALIRRIRGGQGAGMELNDVMHVLYALEKEEQTAMADAPTVVEVPK